MPGGRRKFGLRYLRHEIFHELIHILDTAAIDVVLLDLRMPGNNGIDVLREIKRRRPEAVVVIMTGFATVHSAVQAMKAGAYDYISKPFSFDELRLVLDRVSAQLKLAVENRMLRDAMKSKHGFGSLIGRAPEMEKLYRIIAKASNSSHPVLILGESGTGKELVARSIHFGGAYRDHPFIAGGLRLAGSDLDRERAVWLCARCLYRCDAS